MKSLKVKIFATITFLLVTPFSLASSQGKEKYERAMIYNGGGFKTAMFLGMLKGAKDSGLKPDLVIGTCGGSIAAAVAHSIKDYDSQLEFVRSREFYHLLKTIELTNYASVGKTLGLLKDFYLRYKYQNIIPDIFNNYLMDVPQNINLSQVSGDFTPKHHRTIIIGAKVLYGQKDIGLSRGRKKLFQETIFTDDQTANRLKGFTAPLSYEPNSSISRKVKIKTDAKLIDAARASISDPFYMKPITIHGDRYVTGAVDLYPVEMAKELSKEVIMLYPEKFDVVEQGAIYSTFHFSHNRRHKSVFMQDIDYLVDYTDFDSELKFTPKPDFLNWEIKSRVPKTYEKYREIVRRQFNYGYRRMLEAANNKKSRKHLRNIQFEKLEREKYQKGRISSPFPEG